jgi:hypothetical protein
MILDSVDSIYYLTSHKGYEAIESRTVKNSDPTWTDMIGYRI